MHGVSQWRGPGLAGLIYGYELRARSPYVHVILQDVAYGGASRLGRPVDRAAASAVLHGRRRAGGQQQTYNSIVNLKTRHVQRSVSHVGHRVGEAAATKQLIDHLRVTSMRRIVEQSGTTLGLHVVVGSIRANHGPVIL
jgi:hypothetical protein